MAEKRESVVEQTAEERIERADQLAREAASYWRTSLRGLFALPNATALSVSSAVLYVTGVAEQQYKKIEALSGRIGDEITRGLGDSARTSLPESDRKQRQVTA